ncbi:hypothetical protein CVT24_000996 [Panaeolus cyanescens]|uniref:Uncharacterized protein n=1 Tax=Panaeolus cyanescens TaxID=181874 RepID=A0A409YCH7_9AGAR|nr:hypothetical protein CVT24_000996 [Panaeolus cyanescens]
MDPERIFNHFCELGMPSNISLNDFRRMCSLNDGKFGILLEDIKKQLLGRQGTENARMTIHQLREDFNKDHKNLQTDISAPKPGVDGIPDHDLLNSTKAAAKIRLESAERVLIATKSEWAVESERHDSLGIMIHPLKMIETDSPVALLTAQVTNETDRKSIVGTNATLTDTRLPRPKNTVEMLTNLTAYHLRMQKALSSSPPESAALELQLRNIVHKHHEVLNPGKTPDEIIHSLIDIAKARAERRSKFNASPSMSEMPTDHSDSLEAQRSINQAKRQEIEHTLREIIRLKLESENHIDTIASFREEASTSLQKMLQEEQTRVLGYVDTLKDSILNDNSDHESEDFVFEVRKLLGSSRVHVWEDLRQDLSQLQASQELLHLNLDPRQDQPDLARRSAKALENVDRSGHKLKLLLERKGKKADYGIQLAEEIKDIMGAHRKLR